MRRTCGGGLSGRPSMATRSPAASRSHQILMGLGKRTINVTDR